MISRLKILFIPIAFIFLLVASTSCISYEEVKIENVESVDVKQFSKEGIIVAVAMRINNPNNYKISIIDSDLTVYSGGKDLGKTKINEKIVLPKKSSEVHNFTLEADYNKVMSAGIISLTTILSGGAIELGIRGDMKAKAFMINKKFRVDMKEKVQINL